MTDFLNFDLMKKEFEFETNENTLIFKVPFAITGNTGKKVNLVGYLKTLKPPKEFENTLLVVSKKIKGRGQIKYRYEGFTKLDKVLLDFSSTQKEFELDTPFYVGAVKIQKKDGAALEPFVYTLSELKEKNIAISEKCDNGVVKNYFKIDDAYYLGEADPIRDVASGKSEMMKKDLFDLIKMYTGKVLTPSEIKRVFPIALYKGYAPVRYFSKKIGFANVMYYTNQNIVKDATSNQVTINTLKHCLYANDAYEELILRRLKVNDLSFIGEDFPDYKKGDKVKVLGNIKEKEGLENLEGTVLTRERDKIRVQFFGYFTTDFCITEIKKI